MKCLKITIFLSAILLCVCVEVPDDEYALMPEVFHLDDFDRCLMLGKKALYCTVQMQLMPIRNATNTRVWHTIQEVISSKKNYRHDWLRHGICIPFSCPNMTDSVSSYINNETSLQKEIEKCYSYKLQDIGLTSSLMKIQCETEKPLYEIDGYDIAVAICFLVLVTLVLFSSFYEGLARYKSKEHYHQITSTKHGKIIACFSIPKNWERLKEKSTDSNSRALTCLNGIRFYSMLLVIMCHASMMGFITFNSNPKFGETLTMDPVNMLFLNGNSSMQVFLVMSSWLLSYNFFLIFERQPKFKPLFILYAFVHRYIRLTVPLIAVIAFNATWIQHINRGPLWDKLIGTEYRNCRKNWWVNLLYINNYYDFKQMCLLQTWYIAADTQLFVLSLFVIAIVWNCKKHAFLIFGSLLVVGLIIPAVVNYVNDYDILIRQYPENLYNILLDVPEWTQMVIPGHTNISGCAIGLIAGYVFYKYQNKKIITKTYHHVLWWLITWTFPLSVIFIGVPLYDDEYVGSRLGAAVYATIAKSMYAFGLTVGIFGITQNVGWLLRDAILMPPLQFLGRLTYCVYLVHVALVRIRSGQARTKAYVTVYSFIYQACSDLVLSYIVALLLCLFVEMPTSALQKLTIPKLKKDTEDEIKKRENSETEISKV